ncbi:Ig-like domain-containing protein [Prolixibacter denitrificans]|uniref:SbsA Ig-like domain-containing protein n=2 Tax=Prolixibacter denitrificans TaxID=1541063 RepID=A0ABQ0ZGX0_9BACT|nr:Ig-like domain-containing protein [Prolixibacter denitrificans]GET20707.1 hypothetical protein JCM18694_09530 [Prolixibacter denitrificans]
MDKKFPYLIILVFGSLALYTSCANMGMPSGGAKDTIPPVVIRSIPQANQTNYKGDEVRLYFDEFVVPEKLNEKFVISPPIDKRPIFRTKGKSLIVDLNGAKLKDSTTYSLDFKDAIVDNNEKNPLKNYRLAFSTGPDLDTLRVVGFVLNSFNLEPSAGTYVMLYKNLSDTAVLTTKPDYVAKTDDNGFFAVTNLPKATYNVYAVTDNDNNMMLTSTAEPVAFLDSTVTPSAKYFPKQDTAVVGMDTLLVFGKTRFYPNPLYLLQFEQPFFDLRLDNETRPTRKYVDLTFTQSVKDTFDIQLLNYEPKGNWKYIEHSANDDSLRVWLTDSMVYKKDTLKFRVTYEQQDSTGVKYAYNDTINLYFSDAPTDKKRGRRDRRKIEKKDVNVSLSLNTRSNGFDVYKNVSVESPEPVKSMDTSMIHLFVKQDTVFNPIDFKILPDSINKRRFFIHYPWDYKTAYRLKIDSAAVTTIYGAVSDSVENTFVTQEEEHYGTINFAIQNVTGPTIIQLLKNDDKEEVVRSKTIYKDGTVEFPYLEPQKYKVKAIFDRNDNGKWDTGNLEAHVQPEEVFYYPEVLKLRSNWTMNPTWQLSTQEVFKKDIVDKEKQEEEAKRKKKERNSKAF